jgi:c-di-GMP-binding flagellar brake protein YcgR
MREDRQFTRWKVSIPCVVVWKNEVVKAQITNLSTGGALIAQASLIPAEDAQVIVVFQVGQEEMRFTAKVTSKVVHSQWEITEDDQTATFGVEFIENQNEIESKLASLVGTLIPSEVKEDPSEN